MNTSPKHFSPQTTNTSFTTTWKSSFISQLPRLGFPPSSSHPYFVLSFGLSTEHKFLMLQNPPYADQLLSNPIAEPPELIKRFLFLAVNAWVDLVCNPAGVQSEIYAMRLSLKMLQKNRMRVASFTLSFQTDTKGYTATVPPCWVIQVCTKLASLEWQWEAICVINMLIIQRFQSF